MKLWGNSCRRVAPRLMAYLDGEVSQKMRVWLEDHLAECESCQDRLADLAQDIAAAERLSITPAPEGFAERVMSRLQGQLAAQAQVRESGHLGFWRQRWAWAVGLAAIAGLAVLIWSELWPGGVRAPAPPQPVAASAGSPQVHAPPAETPEAIIAALSPDRKEQLPQARPRANKRKYRQPLVKPTSPETAAANPEELAQLLGQKPVEVKVASYYEAGQLLEEMGMLEEARQAYAAVESPRQLQLAYLGLGRVNEMMGDSAAALEAYGEAAFATPANSLPEEQAQNEQKEG